jgi:PAS domain S-box-containing protein
MPNGSAEAHTASGEAEPRIIADRNGVIQQWDRGATDLLGYPADEAVGRRVDLIVPPALVARHWRGFEKAVGNGELKRPGATLKVPAIRKGGAVIAVRGTLALTRSDDGTVSAVTLTLLGRGGRWSAAAWRVALALLGAAGRLARRRDAHAPDEPA